MADNKIEITEAALKNISNMEQRVSQIHAQYGEASSEYIDAERSLRASLAQVLRLGGNIFAEDDLNLIGNSFITYGVIAHRKYKGNCGSPKDLVVEWSVHS